MEELRTPTPRELEILKVLWDRGPSTVKEVHQQQFQAQDVAYNTVQTLLRLMTTKGLVRYHLDGRTFVYTACFSRDESTARFLDDVFDGAASEMVLSLLRSERLSDDELAQMQAMIDTCRKKGRKAKEGGRS